MRTRSWMLFALAPGLGLLVLWSATSLRRESRGQIQPNTHRPSADRTTPSTDGRESTVRTSERDQSPDVSANNSDRSTTVQENCSNCDAPAHPGRLCGGAVEYPPISTHQELVIRLTELQSSTDKGVQQGAAYAIGRYLVVRTDDSYLAEITAGLMQAAESSHPEVRQDCQFYLSRLPSEHAFDAFLRIGSREDNWDVQWAWFQRVDAVGESAYWKSLADFGPREAKENKELHKQTQATRLRKAIAALESVAAAHANPKAREKALEVLKSLKRDE